MRANSPRSVVVGLRFSASFQPSTLPRLLVRSYSAAADSYNYLQVSKPRPGVGQGIYLFIYLFIYFNTPYKSTVHSISISEITNAQQPLSNL